MEFGVLRRLSYSCLLILLVIGLSSIAFAQSDAAEQVLNQVCDFTRPFIEIQSVSCTSNEGLVSISGDPWDLVDLYEGSGFSISVRNEVGQVIYNTTAIIPVVDDENIEGIPLYIEKKYSTIIHPNGSITYMYENDTTIRPNMILNVSTFHESSGILNLSVKNIPVHTNIARPTNKTGFIVSTDNVTLSYIDPSTGLFTTKKLGIISGIDISENGTLASPDRVVNIPFENSTSIFGLPTGVSTVIRYVPVNRIAGGTVTERTAIDASANRILVDNPANYSAIDSRVKGLLVLNRSIHSSGNKYISITNNSLNLQSLQFIGKIPLVHMTKNGHLGIENHSALPIITPTSDTNFLGNRIIGGIPLLSPEIILFNSTVPPELNAICKITFTQEQILRGVKIVSTSDMKIEKVKIDGEIKFSGEKNAPAGSKTTLFYDEPDYGKEVEIEVSARTNQCPAYERYSKCYQECRKVGFGSKYQKCINECTRNVCYQATFGFTEVSSKLPELKASVFQIQRDSFLAGYTQFLPGESIKVLASVNRDTHTCGCGARKYCHDNLITQCKKDTYSKVLSLLECNKWTPQCPGGWQVTASACHGEVCQLSVIGQILLGALTGWAFGGFTFWQALLLSTGKVILTQVLHVPPLIANLIMGQLFASGWDFGSLFTPEFLLRVAVEYGKGYIYDEINNLFSGGGFFNIFMSTVLTRTLDVFAEFIVDPDLRSLFTSGKWTELIVPLLKDIAIKAAIEAGVRTLIEKAINDPWLVQFASAAASFAISKIKITDLDKEYENYNKLIKKGYELSKAEQLAYKLITLARGGNFGYGLKKSTELSQFTFISEMVSEYLKGQVLAAGASGNSVTCEKEYRLESQFKPHTLQNDFCPTEGTISVPVYRTQTGAKITEAQGYYLCDDALEAPSSGTRATLIIRDSAGNIVRITNTTVEGGGLIGFSNAEFPSIDLPTIPGKYLLEINAREIYQGQEILANYKEEIDIVAPNIEATFLPENYCGTGESKTYLLQINSSVNHPVIAIESNLWTPFSMPYVPKEISGRRSVLGDITLGEIGPSCEFTGLMWWNQSLKTFQSSSDPMNENILPGLGYYAKSSNRCTIFFNSQRFFGGSPELFESSKLIKFEDIQGPASSGNFVLVGSVGNKISIDEATRRCPEPGYRFDGEFPVTTGLKKAVYFIEAEITANPTLPQTSFNPSLNYANYIEPGKAYWAFIVNDEECTFTKQSSSPPFMIKSFGLNATENKAVGWEIQKDDFPDDITIGIPFYKGYRIVPNPEHYDQPGRYGFSSRLENKTLFVNLTSIGSYTIIEEEPSVNITEIVDDESIKEFRIAITNNNLPICQNNLFYLKLQAPEHWRGKITDGESNREKVISNITPGQTDDRIIATMRPRGSSLPINILVTTGPEKNVLNYEDIFDLIALTPATRIKTNSTHVFFVNNFASEKEKIGLVTTAIDFFNPEILYPGIIHNKRFGEIGHLDYANRNIIFTEKKEKITISKLDTRDYSISVIYQNLSSLDRPITTDSNTVYFYDNAIYKIKDGVVEHLTDASDVVSITKDQNNIYFLERTSEKSIIKKIAKAGSAVDTIIELSGINYRVSDIEVDENDMYIAVNDTTYGRILKLNKATRELETVAGLNNIDDIAIDNRMIYIISGFGIRKIEKITKTFNHRFEVIIPGHEPPLVAVNNQEGVPGEVLKFEINVRNMNNNSPETSMVFFIKNIELDAHLERDFSSDFRCELNSRSISRGREGKLYLCLNSSSASDFGESYRFNISIGAMDAFSGQEDVFMNVNVSANYAIKAPGEPFVHVKGDKIRNDELFLEHQAVITKGNIAWYDVTITNTENRDNEFSFDVKDISYQVYDRYREIPLNLLRLGHRAFDRRETVSIKIDASELDYTQQDYTLRVFNSQSNASFTDATLGLIVTPCNYNNVCNIEDYENRTNCPDCRSDIECLYGDECDITTQEGVTFGATVPKLDKFAVCKRNEPDFICLDELQRGCPGDIHSRSCHCSLDDVEGIASCSIQCVDDIEYYYILGVNNDTTIKSSTHLFNCPTCLGNVRNQYENWLLNKKQSHLTTDCCVNGGGNTCGGYCGFASSSQYQACLDTLSFILDSSGEIQNKIDRTNTDRSLCSSTTNEIEKFMKDMDELYNTNCRQFIGFGNLVIKNIENNTVTVKNNGTIDYYSNVRCRYRQASFVDDISSCEFIPKGQEKVFNVNPQLNYGVWSVECFVNGSFFNNCRASSQHSSLTGPFVSVPFPETNFEVIDFNAETEFTTADFTITVKNNGANGNALVKCEITSPTNNAQEITSSLKFIDYNKSSSIRISQSLQESGIWTIKSCSVFHQGALHHKLAKDVNFLIASVCSNECKNAGYDYGICSSSASCTLNEVSASGCNKCCCGSIELSGSCNQDKNITIDVSWVEGDYVRISNQLHTESPVGIVKPTKLQQNKIPVEVFYSNRIVYKKDLVLTCPNLPNIKIISPRNNSNIREKIYVEINKGPALLYYDQTYIAEINESNRIFIDTTKMSNGKHVLTATACNDHGCSEDMITVFIVNGLSIKDYDFSLEPSYRTFGVAENYQFNITFVIKNTGLNQDRYRIDYLMNPDWITSISDSEIVLQPEEEKNITAYIFVNTNSSSILELNTFSYGSTVLKKASVNFSIREINFPPEIISISASPKSVGRGELLTFYSEIKDRENDTLNVRVCRDRECKKEYCEMLLKESLGKKIYQCSYLIDFERGSHVYHIIASDEKDISISLGGLFFVEDFQIKDYDFTIDPYQQENRVIAGERNPTRFRLINTGERKDIFDIGHVSSKNWKTEMFVNEDKKTFVELLPNQSIDITVITDVPVVNIGTKQNIELSIYSRSTKILRRAYSTASVENIVNRAPEIREVSSTTSMIKGQNVTFYADIVDPDNDNFIANVCNNRDCVKLYCTMFIENSTNTCRYSTNESGTFEYYVIATDSNGLSSTSYSKRFFVREIQENNTKNIINRTNDINGSSHIGNDDPKRAIDNNYNTYWTSRNLPAWIVVDLGELKHVIGFGIYSESPTRPKEFLIRGSKDCNNYFDIHKEEKVVYQDDWIKKFFSSITARCVMLYVTNSESNVGYTSVSEFEVYVNKDAVETKPTQNITEEKPTNITKIIEPLVCKEDFVLVNGRCVKKEQNDYTLIWILIMLVIILIIVFVLRKQINEFINKMKLRSYYSD